MSKTIKVDLKEYYEDFKGEDSIIELNEKQYNSFINVFNEYKRNEEKHRKRINRSSKLYAYIEGASEQHNEILMQNNVLDTIIDKDFISRFEHHLELLTPTQARRLRFKIINRLTEREIAKIEGVNHSAIHKSIASAEKIIKNIFEKG